MRKPRTANAGRVHSPGLVNEQLIALYRSTTVMPAPPNCTCSSAKWVTLGTVDRYYLISWRRMPLPFP